MSRSRSTRVLPRPHKDGHPTDFNSLCSHVAQTIGLKYQEDLRTLIFTAAYFFLLGISWNIESCRASLLLWPVLVWFSFIGATTTHNTMHCPLFRRRGANQVFQTVLSLTYGHPVSTYVPGHNLSHHKFTQLRQDIMRTTKVQYKWNLLNLALFQPSILAATIVSDLKYLKIQQRLGRAFFDQAAREFFWLMVVQVALLLLDWKKFLVLWFLPHLIAQWGIVTINLLQHDGCETLEDPDGDASWAVHPNTARDFTGSWVNFFTNNNGYHSIHHLHPEMHWSLLPEAHRREVLPYQHSNLRHDNMLKYILQTYVYPGSRARFDGAPVSFPYPVGVVDLDWIYYPSGIKPQDVSSDWFSNLQFLASAWLLVLCKLVSPLWSPVTNLL